MGDYYVDAGKAVLSSAMDSFSQLVSTVQENPGLTTLGLAGGLGSLVLLGCAAKKYPLRTLGAVSALAVIGLAIFSARQYGFYPMDRVDALQLPLLAQNLTEAYNAWSSGQAVSPTVWCRFTSLWPF